jgi:hypothetical protein
MGSRFAYWRRRMGANQGGPHDIRSCCLGPSPRGLASSKSIGWDERSYHSSVSLLQFEAEPCAVVQIIGSVSLRC